MRRKLLEQIKTVEALAPQALKPGAITPVGTVVDRKGYLSLRAMLQVGITTSASTASQDIEGVLYTSNDSATATSFATFNTANFSVLVTAADTAGASFTSSDALDLSGAYRFVQLRLTGTNTTTGAVSASIAASFVLGDAQIEPAT
jgi:hypothetical protein